MTTTPLGDGVVAAVRAAHVSWAATPVASRCETIRRIGRRFAARADEVASVVCRETKKHPTDAYFADVVPNLELFFWWADKGIRTIAPTRVGLSRTKYPGKEAATGYEPRGVIGLITPWNYPAALPLRTLVPALVAGNAVLFKPSEHTPDTGRLVAEICNAELPGGVLSLVQGGPEAGEAVVDAADHVVFTGSVAAGRKVAVRCAEQLKTCSLELGGKDAAIVLADCALERTAQGVFWGAMTNSGQNCASIERVYVERPIYDTFLARLIALAEQHAVAPVATEAQDALVGRHLADAEARGATLHGRYPPGPVILTDVPDDALVVTEETFGPVCPITPVDSWEEALVRANRSAYGLTLSIWTQDEPRARTIAEKAHTGVVTVNNVALTGAMPFAPWSGRRQSGHGVTNSYLAMLDLVQPKFVLIDRGRKPEPWWFPLEGSAVELAKTMLGWLTARGVGKAMRTFGVLGALKRRSKEQRGDRDV